MPGIPTIPTSLQAHLTDAGLFSIRAITGIVFIYHGAQKLFGAFGGPGIEGFAGFLASLNIPLPTLNAYLAGGAEFFGGLALLTGIAARFFALPLVITMLVASFMVHGGAFSAQANGMEYPLTLALVTLGIGLTGPGRWTIAQLVPASPKAKLTVAPVVSRSA